LTGYASRGYNGRAMQDRDDAPQTEYALNPSPHVPHAVQATRDALATPPAANVPNAPGGGGPAAPAPVSGRIEAGRRDSTGGRQPPDAVLPKEEEAPPATGASGGGSGNPRASAIERLWQIVSTGSRRASVRVWRRRAMWGALLALTLIIIAVAGPSKSDLYAAAATARASWRYDRALSFYAEAARQDPDDPHTHCLIGQVLALQQLYAQASAELTRCQRMGENDSAVWLALGDVAHARGDVAGAERDWQQSADRGSVTARRRLALQYEAQGQFDAAAAQWRALGSQDGQAQAHLGLLALREGDYSSAEAAFVAARFLPGTYGQDMVDQGFVSLAAQAPADGPGLTEVGIAFVQAGYPTFAQLPLEKALALDPHIGLAHAFLAWADWTEGDQGDARAEIALARQLTPGDSFTLFAAATMEMAAGEWRTAENDLEEAALIDSKNPVLWEAEGQAALGMRDYLRAELAYETAASLASESEPEYAEALLRFYIAHRLGLTDGRASRAALQATERWPGIEEIQTLAAQIDMLTGQVSQAYLAYQQANQLDGSDPEPYYELGLMDLAGGDYDMAARELRTAIALRPDGPLAQPARMALTHVAELNI
jgi:tetratricopeptide (TPR) repeat protein